MRPVKTTAYVWGRAANSAENAERPIGVERYSCDDEHRDAAPRRWNGLVYANSNGMGSSAGCLAIIMAAYVYMYVYAYVRVLLIFA